MSHESPEIQHDIEAQLSMLRKLASSDEKVVVMLEGSSEYLSLDSDSYNRMIGWTFMKEVDTDALLRALGVTLPKGIQRTYTTYQGVKAAQDYSPYQVSFDVIQIPSLSKTAYVLDQTEAYAAATIRHVAIQLGSDLSAKESNPTINTIRNILHLRLRRV